MQPFCLPDYATPNTNEADYQQREQDAKRRDQILASLEQTLREGLESGKVNAAQQEKRAAEFQRARMTFRFSSVPGPSWG